jgi:tetratricopeptide (TPR) repeat protein
MMLFIGLSGFGGPAASAADAAPQYLVIPGLAELIRQRDWARASETVDRALERAPDNLAALYWKSFVLFQKGDYRQASTLAERYLKRNPASGEARKILGLAHFMLGQSALAEAELLRASELAPADADVRYYLGRIQFERHNLTAALESFRAVVALDAQSVRGFNHLGQTHEGLARFDDAREAYGTAIEIDRRQARRSEWPYFNLGVLLLKEGRAQEAAGCLREALAVKPSWSEAKVQLAVALGLANELKEARQMLEEVLLAEPKNAQAHYQLARLLVKLQLPEEASRHFRLFAESKRP